MPTGFGSGGGGAACGIFASVEGLFVCSKLVIVYFMLGFLVEKGFGLLLIFGFIDLSSVGFGDGTFVGFVLCIVPHTSWFDFQMFVTM